MLLKKKKKLKVEEFICRRINKRLKENTYTADWVNGVTSTAYLLGVFELEDMIKYIGAAEAIDAQIKKNIETKATKK